MTPIEIALMMQQEKVVQFLKPLSNQQHPHPTLPNLASWMHNNHMDTILRGAAVAGDIRAFKEILRNSDGYDVRNAKGPQGETILHNAAIAGCLNIVEYLINQHKCDCNRGDEDGKTPLHMAAYGGHIEVVKFITAQETCNSGAIDRHGRTPLHFACQNGHTQVAIFLYIQCKCTNDPDTSSGTSPLHLCTANGHLEIVKFFHSKQTKMEVKDKHGRTPLHYACQNGHMQVAKFLYTECECANDPDVESRVTPLHLSAENGHLKIVKYFHSKQTNMDVKDSHGRTPLHYACQGGHTQVAKFLYTQCKCDKNTRDKNDVTPMFLALITKCEDILQIFKQDIPSQFKPISQRASLQHGTARVEVDHFSAFAATAHSEVYFAFHLYYNPTKSLTAYDVHITATKNIKLHVEEVRKEYDKWEQGPYTISHITEERVSLYVPEINVVPEDSWEKDGWIITPVVSPPTLEKELIEEHATGQLIPYFALELTLKDPYHPCSLKQSIHFTGVNPPTSISLTRDPFRPDASLATIIQKYFPQAAPTTPLNPVDDLFDIKRELKPVETKWKHIGLALRLDSSQLNVIEKENKDDLDDCLTEMLTQWLSKNYNTERFGEPSWEMLASAVKDSAGGNNTKVAEDIRTRHKN